MSEGDRGAMIRSMVARLAERLQGAPDDAAGWRRLGRSYGVLGDAAKSRDAYARAAKLRPDDVAVLSEYAAALMRTAAPDRKLPAELVRVADEILRRDADNRNALWLAGIARLQADDQAGARRLWQRLRGLLAPGTAQYEELKERMGKLTNN
jgi:cytochrome c-type biogenesis protein CcmH